MPITPFRLVLILPIVLILNGCAALKPPPVWEKTVPEDARDQLALRLSASGSNRSELEKAYELAPPHLRAYVTLLIERMPAVDLAACTGELLARTVVLADSMRRIPPYAQDVPEEIFQDYVLPLRVSQEPLENFRPYFIGELFALVRDCTSAEGAAVAVNRWCGSKVRFQSTQRRDQGPFETLKSGYGRCEEMMIFFSDACRSLGIPAREAWTPWWSYQDNNHAWTEIWTPEGWKYAGACEPAERLNQAWFTEPAKRAALVLASRQGEARPGEILYRAGERYSLINVTGNYAAVSSVNLKLNSAGQPLAGKDVFVSVYNFGSLRPIARLQTDSLGQASIELGKGDYAVSWQAMSPNLTIIQHRPPAPSRVVLDASQPAAVPESFWLRYDP